MARVFTRVVLAVSTLLYVSAGVSAQQTTTATQTKKFEVIAVNGNELVVKLPEGNRELTVPDDFMFDVDGKQMSVHDLKPGMKGTAHITTKTTTTPVTVTEVRNGTVMQASGASITVRTDNGIRMFSAADADQRGATIMRDGRPISFSDLRTGDRLTATIVTTHPPKVVTEQQVKATLAKEAAAPTSTEPPAAKSTPAKSTATKSTATSGTGTSGTAPSATAPAATASAAAAPAKKLPKTASQQPLVGLIGVLSILSAIGLTVRRRWLEHA
jgi:LPXTG-motif cell wall-anchored protein